MHSVAKILASARMINAIIWKKGILTQKDVQIADSRGAPIGAVAAAAAADTVVVVERGKCIPWYAPSAVIILRFLSNQRELVLCTAMTASKNAEIQERIENSLQLNWRQVPKSVVSFYSKQ